MISIRKHSGTSMVLGVLLILAAQAPRPTSIRGIVTDPDGAPFPGVLVTAESDAGRRTGYTDVEGRYQLDELEPGSYEVRVELPGFCAELRTDLRLAAGSTITVDLSMVLAPVNWNHRYAAEGLKEAYRLADAVAHVSITRSFDVRLWELNGRDWIGIAHEATLVEVVKPVDGSSGDVLQFVQYPAGRLSEGGKTVCGSETPYAAGEEYVAFLGRMGDAGAFRFLGPKFMIPVRQGRISGRWLNNSDVLEVREGMTVGSFLDILRGFPADIVPDTETLANADGASDSSGDLDWSPPRQHVRKTLGRRAAEGATVR